MKVLIVDDEILVRKGLSMGIHWEDIGFHKVLEASNGLQALEIVKKEVPQLVLTDIRMPKMDGLTLIDEIKKLYPDTTIIVLSCLNDSEYIREALKFNRAVDYIPKLSLSTDELVKIVIKAKSYIKERPTTEAVSYKSIFTINRINRLKEAIAAYDEKTIKILVKTCFDEALKHGYTMSTFSEWHDIFAVFHITIKELGGDLSELLIGDISPDLYLKQAIHLEDLGNRFIYFIQYFLTYIQQLESIYLSSEIKNAIHYISHHYNEPLKLIDVASHIGLNESYLSRLFKKQLGKNFTDYLNGLRLEKAKTLLSDYSKPIYEVATLVGYNSESYFSRIFKQYEHITPKKYRQQLK